MSKVKILVVGGTGYLGQHLLQAYAHANANGTPFAFDLAFTHHSSPPPRLLLDAIPSSLPFQVDFKTGSGFEAISNTFVPRACEIDPDNAHAINVPSSLVKWLQSFEKNRTLLIHLSTDQVYEGEKSFYKEEDNAVPVNVYGKTKVAAEEFISENFPNFAILRSSIIYGPQTVSPVAKSLPIQWIDGSLAKGEKVEFFHDEFRCPIYVMDLVSIILALTNQWISEGKQMQLLLNVGGSDRLSRVQMAEAVALFRGYDTSLIKSVSASSVDRGVKSPADISMDITKLVQTLKIYPVSFKDGVRLTLTTEARE
ncbi:methionine adenosyltransferase 2 subunit beta isoform X2 [Cajanus cajan]|uniref:methionine adenosyltransferase 2 subunit beta isoform X2 n=1 Tax=Cajanus cajan TaxID=3821 RepID=UPI00098DD17F|nr:methionine adenosyltransferase 2 subunit beta isoform X2 [Cajanus cajan]